jgi:TetR/AcrR family transcriptional repressor of nem operon
MTASKIVEAGHRLIVQRGYSGFSYADVSAAIDIRKASIHHHFPTKVELAIAVVRQSREMFDAEIGSLTTAGVDPLTQIGGYVGYWERCIVDQSAPFCVAGMLGAELPSLPEALALEVRAHFANLTAWLVGVFRAGVKAKQLTLSDPVETEAASFTALVYGAMLTARACRDPSLFGTVMSSAMARIVKGGKSVST